MFGEEFLTVMRLRTRFLGENAVRKNEGCRYADLKCPKCKDMQREQLGMSPQGEDFVCCNPSCDFRIVAAIFRYELDNAVMDEIAGKERDWKLIADAYSA